MTVAKACELVILENIDQVMGTEKGSKFILNLPFKYMESFCSNNRLNVSSEYALAQLIENYLNHRDSLPPLEEPKPDFSGLSPEEREAKEKELQEKEDAEKAKKEEEEKAAKEAYDALDDLGKIKHDLKKEEEVMKAECEARLKC